MPRGSAHGTRCPAARQTSAWPEHIICGAKGPGRDLWSGGPQARQSGGGGSADLNWKFFLACLPPPPLPPPISKFTEGKYEFYCRTNVFGPFSALLLGPPPPPQPAQPPNHSNTPFKAHASGCTRAEGVRRVSRAMSCMPSEGGVVAGVGVGECWSGGGGGWNASATAEASQAVMPGPCAVRHK